MQARFARSRVSCSNGEVTSSPARPIAQQPHVKPWSGLLTPEDLALPFVAKAQLAGVDLAEFWPDSCEQATPAWVALLD